MGTRRPENVPMVVWRGGCETVGQMIEKQWDVITRCSRCQTRTHVALKVVLLRARGRNFSLWNRRPRCQIVGCGAPMIYMAKPPGCFVYRDLEAEWPANRPAPGSTGYDGPR